MPLTNLSQQEINAIKENTVFCFNDFSKLMRKIDTAGVFDGFIVDLEDNLLTKAVLETDKQKERY